MGRGGVGRAPPCRIACENRIFQIGEQFVFGAGHMSCLKFDMIPAMSDLERHIPVIVRRTPILLALRKRRVEKIGVIDGENNPFQPFLVAQGFFQNEFVNGKGLRHIGQVDRGRHQPGGKAEIGVGVAQDNSFGRRVGLMQQF